MGLWYRPAGLGVMLALLASPLDAQSAPSPTTASLRGLSVARDGAVWASGSNGTVLRSTDGGRSWELHPIPDAASFDLRDVEALSATVAYAMVAGNDTARIYRTANGGKTWARQYDDTRPGVFLDGIAFWDAAHGIAAGDPMDGRFLVLRTDDGGAHWTRLPAAAAPQALAGEAAFAASGTAIAVGPGGRAWLGTGGATGGDAAGRVFRSGDYGRTWEASVTPIPAGSASTGIFSVAFRDSMNGIVAGGDYANPRASRVNVALTMDGGRTWAVADSARATGYLSAVVYVGRGSGRRVVGVGTAGVFESPDDGRTWIRTDSTGYNAVAARGGGIVAVGERGRISAWKSRGSTP